MNNYLIIPIYDTVLLPDVDYQFGADPLSEAEEARIKQDEGMAVLLPMRAEKEKSSITREDVHSLGLLAEIIEVTETHLGTRFHAQSHEKVLLHEMNRTSDDYLAGNFEDAPENHDITEKGEQDFLNALKKTTLEVASHVQGGQFASAYLNNCHNLNEYGAMFCQFFGMTPEEKYALLKTDSQHERAIMIQDALLKFKGTIDLQVDMNRLYNDSEGNVYKKAALQKQMSLLQEEMDRLDPDSVSEEDSYKKKIADSGMPDEARKEAERVLKRYMEAQPNDPERSTLENYLDYITSLKWKPDELETPDLEKARKILDRDHYGLKKPKERILQQIAVMRLKHQQGGSILLLVGAPGTGKTSLGKSIAEALGRKYTRISLGGIRDEAEIRGHRRTYVGAMPGRIMEGIRRAGSMNPVIVLDEVDKLSQSFNGDPASALLEVLDPEQNNTFTDHYLNVPYDLSNVFFICTANTYDTIPQPLLDRMETISLPGYTPIEKLQIARRHLLPRAIQDAGISKDDLHITDGALRRIISEYTMEAGVRGLKKQLDIICRKTAVELISSGEEHHKVNIRERNVTDYLEGHGILHDRILKHCPPGVATGLAWTQVGGEILFIETTAMNGNGQIILTGQLGDVMKESAEIGVSLVKSLFSGDNLNFKNKDIHIHVPEGAVPKDGPSAGVTLFTALVSLITGKSVPSDLAMTGEISLRGQVLPIGGLPEKLMAADRAGVKKVLIPRENMRDMDDVAEEVRKNLTIVPVDTVRDVIKEALHITLPSGNRHFFQEGTAEPKKSSAKRKTADAAKNGPESDAETSIKDETSGDSRE